MIKITTLMKNLEKITGIVFTKSEKENIKTEFLKLQEGK